MTGHLTIGSAIDKLEHLRLKQAVNKSIMNYLNQFISSDSFTPQAGIASPLSADPVPEEVVEEVRDEIEARNAEIDKDIEKIRGHTVVPVKASKVAPKRRKA